MQHTQICGIQLKQYVREISLALNFLKIEEAENKLSQFSLKDQKQKQIKHKVKENT